MLTIRNEQMAEFRARRLAEFEAKLERRLAEFAGGASLEEFQGRIRRGLEHASAYWLERESDIARFLTIAFRRGAGFPDQALPVEAQSILYAYGMDPVLKLDRFEKWRQEEADGGRLR